MLFYYSEIIIRQNKNNSIDANSMFFSEIYALVICFIFVLLFCFLVIFRLKVRLKCFVAYILCICVVCLSSVRKWICCCHCENHSKGVLLLSSVCLTRRGSQSINIYICVVRVTNRRVCLICFSLSFEFAYNFVFLFLLLLFFL